MKKYYSHYTFIYPDKYYKDVVVELNEINNIIRVFPFEEEIENTQFYPGIIVYIPNSSKINPFVIDYAKDQMKKKFDDESIDNAELKAVICNIPD